MFYARRAAPVQSRPHAALDYGTQARIFSPMTFFTNSCSALATPVIESPADLSKCDFDIALSQFFCMSGWIKTQYSRSFSLCRINAVQ